MIDYLLYKSTINWWNCWNKLGPAIARDLRAKCRRWCLNEGRTPSKRRSSFNPKFFDNEITQTCSNFTRSSISRSIFEVDEERADPDAKWYQHFHVFRHRFDTDQAGQHHVAEHVPADNFRPIFEDPPALDATSISWFVNFSNASGDHVTLIDPLESMARLWYFSKFSIITDCFQCFIRYLG